MVYARAYIMLEIEGKVSNSGLQQTEPLSLVSLLSLFDDLWGRSSFLSSPNPKFLWCRMVCWSGETASLSSLRLAGVG